MNENHQKIVRIEKNRVELGIILEASKTQRRGVQIKEIKVFLVVFVSVPSFFSEFFHPLILLFIYSFIHLFIFYFLIDLSID